ncbi:hypothetical protein RYX36_030306 [Vicia faba]
MPRMDNCKDFLSWVDPDTSLNIFKCPDDPADLARVSCVSRSWRDFVVANGLSKQLCLRMFPQLSRVACVVELNQDGVKEHSEVGSSQSNECLALWKDHRVYSYLARSCLSPVSMDCIDKAISASSTDNFPQESIVNTLEERDNIAGRFSYWSSSGQSNPNVPETLTYQLASQICVITEINIQPFQAHFQMGSPIYSAKSVRFKMGHLKASLDDLTDAFVWTYTSPEFPMAQDFAYLYDPNNETAGAFVPAQILYDAFHGRYHNSAGAIGFVTNNERALEELYGDEENNKKVVACLNVMATRVASVFASLRKFPFVRFHAARSLDANTMTTLHDLIPTKLAAGVWDSLMKYKKSIPNFPQTETCELLIIDRTIDQIAPLIHEWTYDAMCHDLLNMEGNKYVHEIPGKNGGQPERKEVLLEDHDPIWLELRYAHIADASVRLHEKMTNFISKNKAAQIQHGSR